MKICVHGTGYVGLVTGACLADTGNDVICFDIDADKIEKLKGGVIPIYEPGLEELLRRNVEEGRLAFSTDLEFCLGSSEVHFIAVGTPNGDDGCADITNVFQVAREIGRSMDGYRVIVIKSTVPVGTADEVRQIIAQETPLEFDVVSNPEFLKEGGAVEDFMMPERIVIGTNSRRAREIMRELYSP
ncbi:MAG: nucleotide sugar dehydrogenase, partial [Thermodesulfobacteriota bacterium]